MNKILLPFMLLVIVIEVVTENTISIITYISGILLVLVSHFVSHFSTDHTKIKMTAEIEYVLIFIEPLLTPSST